MIPNTPFAFAPTVRAIPATAPRTRGNLPRSLLLVVCP